MMRVAALLLVAALNAGCSLSVQESELYGVYVADYKNGREQLALERGGKFVQEVTLQGSGSPVVNSGNWDYDPSMSRVALQNCLGVTDGFGNIRPDFATARGGCSFSVARRWFVFGDLRLGPEAASTLRKIR